MTKPSHGLYDHIMAFPSPIGDVKIVSPVSTVLLNTLTFSFAIH